MTLKGAQKLQMAWVALGLTYNAVSYWRISMGETALSALDPLSGAIFVSVCGAFIVAGMLGANSVYRFTAPVITVLVAYGGVFSHVNAWVADATLPQYVSSLSWLAAIVCNSYGVAVLAAGSWLAVNKTSP